MFPLQLLMLQKLHPNILTCPFPLSSAKLRQIIPFINGKINIKLMRRQTIKSKALYPENGVKTV